MAQSSAKLDHVAGLRARLDELHKYQSRPPTPDTNPLASAKTLFESMPTDLQPGHHGLFENRDPKTNPEGPLSGVRTDSKVRLFSEHRCLYLHNENRSGVDESLSYYLFAFMTAWCSGC